MIQKLPKDWEIKELNRVIVDIIDYRGKTPRKLGGNWAESGTIALSAMNVKQGQLVNLEKARFVNDELYNKWMKSEVIKGDILMTSEAPLGETYLIPDDRKICLSQRLFCIRADSSVVLPQFLFYFFNSPISRKQIDLRATGTTVLGIRQSDLRETPIIVPPLTTQRKIAAVLSGYDDLIENNTRRIKILEDMAQTLYQEWFVHFRLPGHENVPMVESPLGPIPQGWEILKYSDIVDLSRKGINPTKFPDETFAHFSIPAFDSGQMPFLEEGSSIRSSKYLITEGCVLVSKLNPRIPRVWFPFLNTEHRAITSTEFLTLKPKPPIDCVFLYNLCRSPEFSAELAVRASGTSGSHQRVKPNDFLGMSVLIPTEFLLISFRKKVVSILNIVNTLRLKNVNLRQTRDLLLPKLISGKIDVSELDIDTAPKSN